VTADEVPATFHNADEFQIFLLIFLSSMEQKSYTYPTSMRSWTRFSSSW